MTMYDFLHLFLYAVDNLDIKGWQNTVSLISRTIETCPSLKGSIEAPIASKPFDGINSEIRNLRAMGFANYSVTKDGQYRVALNADGKFAVRNKILRYDREWVQIQQAVQTLIAAPEYYI